VLSGVAFLAFNLFLYALIQWRSDQPFLMILVAGAITWLFGWLVYRLLENNRIRGR
jgi:peptidoglycan/LPS O-acetylase OafA/YrhL